MEINCTFCKNSKVIKFKRICKLTKLKDNQDCKNFKHCNSVVTFFRKVKIYYLYLKYLKYLKHA